VGLGLDFDDGQTPLDEDEKEGLLIATITTRGELDEFEQLVCIHPFANGNGRHSRLIADVLVSNGLGRPQCSWGSLNLTAKGAARSAYLQALRRADQGDMKDLVQFARQ